jgi:hypothetical protein
MLLLLPSPLQANLFIKDEAFGNAESEDVYHRLLESVRCCSAMLAPGGAPFDATCSAQETANQLLEKTSHYDWAQAIIEARDKPQDFVPALGDVQGPLSFPRFGDRSVPREKANPQALR